MQQLLFIKLTEIIGPRVEEILSMVKAEYTRVSY
ncbi:hypothetical protein REISMN_06575 [Rickettsia tamurae subsp. buchneri]|uniref:Uncharacterized protein n=1 Tax=Rickettsia tamurae subsp. buchneri TaxID=1462938 RepID=A0A8E1BZS8_9RICK|nr:hypothetical protein REISMN_06575 [Rickettsia tamurae subsp. buchneri]